MIHLRVFSSVRLTASSLAKAAAAAAAAAAARPPGHLRLVRLGVDADRNNYWLVGGHVFREGVDAAFRAVSLGRGGGAVAGPKRRHAGG